MPESRGRVRLKAFSTSCAGDSRENTPRTGQGEEKSAKKVWNVGEIKCYTVFSAVLGFGGSESDLQKLCPQAQVLKGLEVRGSRVCGAQALRLHAAADGGLQCRARAARHSPL